MFNNVFNKSGIISRSDINSSDLKSVFEILDDEQTTFLSNESIFRSKNYFWPKKPLHTWSRVWEYPYVYHHIKNIIDESPNENANDLKIVDFGSGVTFFPFSIARLGADVTCLDVDPICSSDINRANECTDSGTGSVSFDLIEGETNPLSDNSVDIVYCISVLEHLSNYESVIEDIHRILKTNGIFVLTIDMDLKGNHDIGVLDYTRLRRILDKYFSIEFPEYSTHPVDNLTTQNSCFPTRESHWLVEYARIFKHKVIYPMLGKKSKYQSPFNLAVWTGVLRAK